MNVRKITPEELHQIHFTHDEVLHNDLDKADRARKLLKAVVLSNVEHVDIGIVIKLDTGEVIETYADLVDFADDFVDIKGGKSIPLKAIVDVEL